MSRSTIFRWLSIVAVAAVMLDGLFSAIPATLAQDAQTPQATGSVTPGTDDSDELPVLLNLTGKIQAISGATLQINNVSLVIPAGMALPAGVQIGTLVTIRANLRNDDTISIITITLGAPTPTPTATEAADQTEEATPQATEQATQSAVAQATSAATPAGTVAGPLIVGCDKPKQQLAVFISTTYDVPYTEVVGWRCKGFTFGVIARAYLLVIAGQVEDKEISVTNVLNLRTTGNRWSVIIVVLGVHPRPESLIIVVAAGNQVVFIVDCRYLKKGKLNNKYCKKPKKPKKKK